MKNGDSISEFTIYRLSIYKRCLEELERENIPTVSSKDLAVRFGLNSAQVRKDLAYFGEFGIRGMGYPVKTLKDQILAILGLAESVAGERTWKAIVLGAGKLGMAILRDQRFNRYGFEFVAAFDPDLETSEYTLQQQANMYQAAVPLYHIEKLEAIIAEHQIDIAILATPEDQAQQITNRLVNAGICAILNFVPVQLLVPKHVKVRTVDLIAELQCLTYHLHKQALAEKQEQEKSVNHREII